MTKSSCTPESQHQLHWITRCAHYMTPVRLGTGWGRIERPTFLSLRETTLGAMLKPCRTCLLQHTQGRGGKGKGANFSVPGSFHSSLLTQQNMNVLVKRPQMKQSSETSSCQDHHTDQNRWKYELGNATSKTGKTPLRFPCGLQPGMKLL